jgi:SH3-like domain-containing protein
MKSRTRTNLATLVLILSLIACNLPGSGEQVPPPGEVQTAAALTVEALLIPPSVTATTQEEQVILPDTPTPTIGPTGTITPTYSMPTLTLREPTNCRTGPGLDYAVLFSYVKGVRLEIIGSYPQENYWLVKAEESPTGECWIWGEYADITGSYWVVSSVTPPPTATMTPPAAPSIQKWEFNCNLGQVTVTIQWKDRANNETGYRVIRDDQVVAELPADSNSYVETISYTAGDKFVYYIEVYNVTGPVRSTPMQFTCP